MEELWGFQVQAPDHIRERNEMLADILKAIADMLPEFKKNYLMSTLMGNRTQFPILSLTNYDKTVSIYIHNEEVYVIKVNKAHTPVVVDSVDILLCEPNCFDQIVRHTRNFLYANRKIPQQDPAHKSGEYRAVR